MVELEGGQSSAKLAAPAAVGGPDVATTMPGVFRAREVDCPRHVPPPADLHVQRADPEAFRDEFVRLAAALPQIGLIIDVATTVAATLRQ